MRQLLLRSISPGGTPYFYLPATFFETFGRKSQKLPLGHQYTARQMKKVFLHGCTVTALWVVCCFTAKAAVVSTFDSSADGWSLANSDPASTLTYQSGGGNPGGYVLFTDGNQGAGDDFAAPAKFLGNDAMFFGGMLSFDLLSNAPADGVAGNPLTITDGSGDFLSLVITAPSTNVWTSYYYILNTSSGFLYDGGTMATAAQIQTVLSNVTSLELPADLVNGPNTTGLDNVVLAAAVPEPAAWLLLSVGVSGLGLAVRRRKLS